MNEKIKELIENGKLIQVVLVDTEGMVIKARGDLYDPEVLSAIFSPFQGLVRNIQENLKVDGVEELSLRTEGRRFRLILRYFTADGTEFFLIAICPISSSYRQITTEIIRLACDDIIQKSFDSPEKEVESIS
ncbi:MAG: roadblock/LC7 domain-containing protein [Candidatus Aminicenantia bacterium]